MELSLRKNKNHLVLQIEPWAKFDDLPGWYSACEFKAILLCTDPAYKQRFTLYLCTHPMPFAHLVAIGGAASDATHLRLLTCDDHKFV
jgi:hypothetical protein